MALGARGASLSLSALAHEMGRRVPGPRGAREILYAEPSEYGGSR